MTNQRIFYTNGALLPDYPNYVLRQSDREAVFGMERGSLVYTIAPRQMGKTSLLKRLAALKHSHGWYCCFIDLASFKNLDRQKWFYHIGQRIAEACQLNLADIDLQDHQDFASFLRNNVGLINPSSQVKLAIFFDEVEGLLSVDFSDEFLMTLRDLYQQRDNYKNNKLLYAFAGAVDHDKLVADPAISPFNVADEIILLDFTKEESLILTSNLNQLDIPVEEEVHEYIYSWVSGQPYLTQRVCEVLERWTGIGRISYVSIETIDKVMKSLINPLTQDKNVRHVVNEIDRLESYPAELWKRLVEGEVARAQMAGYKDLHLTGAIKKATEDKLEIRNRAYREALLEDNSFNKNSLDSGEEPQKTPLIMDFEEANPTNFSNLVNALKQENIVLFVGAGLSIGAGLPGWSELIRPLAEDVKYPWPDDSTFLTSEILLTAAQYYENKHGRNALIRYLSDKLDTTLLDPTSTYEQLPALPARIIFTTNYDDLLERTYQESGIRRKVIISEAQLPYWQESAVQIVKLCGDLQHSDIVVTKKDFNLYFAERPLLANRLRTTLESKIPLFLGYSLRDPFFNQIWDRIGFDYEEHQLEGYAVLFDAQPLEIDDLRQRKIRVINLRTEGRNRTELLSDWLATLRSHSGITIREDDKQTYKTRNVRIEEKLDQLLTGQTEMKQGLGIIYQQVSTDDRKILMQILTAVEQGRVERNMIANTIESLRRWAKHVQKAGVPADPALKTALNSIAQPTEQKGGVYQYLEANLPLIPGILTYKIELGSTHNVDLQELWEQLRKLYSE